MRTTLIILATLFALCNQASAQSIAIGSRAPRVRSFKQKIENGKYLYMGFVHSPSHPCEESAPKVSELIENIEQISAVIFTKERQGECKQWLIDMFENGAKLYMGADDVFRKFGVEYAPFGLILDHKRRVVWQGNPQMLDRVKIENIITQWTFQK